MEGGPKPPRVVGKLGATLMSVNGMIGAGIFALPAFLYAEVGNFAIADKSILVAEFPTVSKDKFLLAIDFFKAQAIAKHAFVEIPDDG